MNKRKWHPASTFPTPLIKLLVRTVDGEYVAIRPNYATSYSSDPDYRSLDNKPIKGVIEWAIL